MILPPLSGQFVPASLHPPGLPRYIASRNEATDPDKKHGRLCAEQYRMLLPCSVSLPSASSPQMWSSMSNPRQHMPNTLGLSFFFLLKKCPAEWRETWKELLVFRWSKWKGTPCRHDDEEQPKPGSCFQPDPVQTKKPRYLIAGEEQVQHSCYHHAPFWQQIPFIPDASINKKSRAGSGASSFTRFRPAESYFAQSSLLTTSSSLRWSKRAWAQVGLYLSLVSHYDKEYFGHNSDFRLSSLSCIQQSIHQGNLPPCKRWRQLLYLKIPLLGEGKHFHPCSPPKAGEREETFWHVCCCKMRRD